MLYKIHIDNRDYTSWTIYQESNLTKIDDLVIDPHEGKLFTGDIFTVDKRGKINIEHSAVRSGGEIPGVLIIDGNKTYGRDTITKSKRLLYKCVPDDARLPAFLVPYEIKDVGFSKVYKNLYITIRFDRWTDKHPVGKIDTMIGPVDINENFYEYQLFCKSLNAPIGKFQKDTHRAVVGTADIFANIKTKYPTVQYRDCYIITIDPKGSQDFDDGFSVEELDDGSHRLSIYIANVPIMLDALQLWSSFSRRVSTIYLPDKKRPMMPSILSDCLCSLQQGTPRLAFVMDLTINSDNHIAHISFSNVIVNVRRNYTYEEPQLLGDPEYHKILAVAQQLVGKYRYLTDINDSHDLVTYLMILMNYYSAKELLEKGVGIFRSTVMRDCPSIPSSVPDDVAKFITIWSSSSGQYTESSARHELLDLDAYVHITSPIRRLVDLLNMIKLQSVLNTITLVNGAYEFYDKWLSQLDYINTTMRSIRKVQIDCNLLDLFYNNEQLLETEYDGYMFDKVLRNDGLYQYLVYLPKIKMSSRITLREDFDNYTNKKFKIFLFNDEERFKRKIRLHLLN